MKNFGIIIALLMVGISACEQIDFIDPDSIVDPDVLVSAGDEYCVELSDALEIGITHFEMKQDDLLKSTGTSYNFKDKKTKELRTFRKDNEDLFHLINYEDGGFIMISADRRVTPVLAYSAVNNFEGEELPGISDWIYVVSEGILKAKRELIKPRKQDERLWEIYAQEANPSLKRIEPPGDECTCDNYVNIFVDQFVDPTARWCQGGQYSWYSPGDGGCSCDRKPAGCGPVAMAMVMNYYQYPEMTMTIDGDVLITDYPMPVTIPYNCNFPSNPDNRQVAMLMRLCGSFAGSIYGILGNCSTATLPSKIDNAFSDMLYSNGGNWGTLSNQYSNVKNDLKSYHPVILTGTTGVLNASNAHIWVADGYSLIRYEVETTYIDEYGEEQCTCVEHSTEMIGMCWGQYNGTSNGFYLANYSFTYNGSTEDLTYDTYLKALTGIRP